MNVNVILATDSKGGIGKNQGLPWPHAPSDMKWFADNTKNGVVVMGRKTWESIGSKALPDRINYVITRRRKFEGNPDGIYHGELSILFKILADNFPNKNIWIIGGAEIYQQGLPLCDSIFLTKFDAEYDCDTFVDLKPELKNMFLMGTKRSNEDKCTMSIWSRI